MGKHVGEPGPRSLENFRVGVGEYKKEIDNLSKGVFFPERNTVVKLIEQIDNQKNNDVKKDNLKRPSAVSKFGFYEFGKSHVVSNKTGFGLFARNTKLPIRKMPHLNAPNDLFMKAQMDKSPKL